MTPVRKAFINTTQLTFLGRGPGAVFKLEVNAEGKPLAVFWRRRFDDGEIAEVTPAASAPDVQDKPAPKRAKAD